MVHKCKGNHTRKSFRCFACGKHFDEHARRATIGGSNCCWDCSKLGTKRAS